MNDVNICAINKRPSLSYYLLSYVTRSVGVIVKEAVDVLTFYVSFIRVMFCYNFRTL